MIKTTLLAAALGLGLVGAASAATVIFEDDFNTETAATNATLTKWTITAGSVDVIPVNGNFNWYPGNGLYIDLNGSTRTAGRIQTKNPLNLVVGNEYALAFDYGRNKNLPTNSFEQLTYGIGTQSVSLQILAEATFVNVLAFFTYDGSGDFLFFADTGNTPGDNGGPIIDNVRLTLAAVPLPAGGLLLIGALGGLAALRRRKARAA